MPSRETRTDQTQRESSDRVSALDTLPEPHFDAVCRTAQALFSVPLAAITMVDADRQWQKARCGPIGESAPREITFCTHTILSDDLFVIEDATEDSRFADNPFVTDQPHIRFYAGVPLILRPGIRIGTLCLMDTVPRQFDAQQRCRLKDLAAIVLGQLRLHESDRLLRQNASSYRHVLETAHDAFISMDRTGAITRWNSAAETTFGWSEEEAVGRSLAEMILPERYRAAHARGMDRYLRTGESAVVGKRRLELTAVRRDGIEIPVEIAMSADPASGSAGFNAFLRDISERKHSEQSLSTSEARYRLLAENATDMIVRADLDGTRRYVSPASKSLFGYEPEELIDTKGVEFLHPDDTGPVLSVLSQISNGAIRQATCTPRIRHKDGSWVWVETLFNVTLDPLTGRPDGYVACVRDITQRLATEEEKRQGEELLRISEERLALALENATDGIWDWRAHPEELWFSPGLISMLGFNADEIGVSIETWVHLIHPDDRETTTKQFFALLKGLSSLFGCEYRLRRKDGGYAWVLARGRVVNRNDAGRALRVVGTHMDITVRKEAEQAVARLARHDVLTGLPNRILFHERLNEALSEVGEPNGGCALLYLDLDRFKTVNDTFGHLAGDSLLEQVAQRLKDAVREVDTVVRLGGDEFAILQIDGASQPASSAALAQRVIEAIAEPFLLGCEQVEVGISIGIALAPQDAAEADLMIKRADLALCRAKSEGRNIRRYYETAMDEALEYRQRLEMDLRGALTRGEFEVHYQPIMNVASGALSSVEALVRWRHPMHGMISPGAFIPLAEETGLIIPIGEWVLRTACQAASTWPGAIRIAINVSAVQFRKGGLPAAVMQALALSGLPAKRLELEITESVLMQDGPVVMDTLHILRKFGVRTALDDFGTGYSSLSYLRRFPFDKLKIDRAFVEDIDNPSTAAIVSAIVTLGIALGMTITAEGIETEEQLTSTRQHGCTEIQGYLYSRPLSEEALVQFIGHDAGRTAA